MNTRKNSLVSGFKLFVLLFLSVALVACRADSRSEPSVYSSQDEPMTQVPETESPLTDLVVEEPEAVELSVGANVANTVAETVEIPAANIEHAPTQQTVEISVSSVISAPLQLEAVAVWQREAEIGFAFVVENNSDDYVNMVQYALRLYDADDNLIAYAVPSEIRPFGQFREPGEDDLGPEFLDFDIPFLMPGEKAGAANIHPLEDANITVARGELEIAYFELLPAEPESPELIARASAYFLDPDVDRTSCDPVLDDSCYEIRNHPEADLEASEDLRVSVVLEQQSDWYYWPTVPIQVAVYDQKDVLLAMQEGQSSAIFPATGSLDTYGYSLFVFPFTEIAVGRVEIGFGAETPAQRITAATVNSTGTTYDVATNTVVVTDWQLPDPALGNFPPLRFCGFSDGDGSYQNVATLESFVAEHFVSQVLVIVYDEAEQLSGFGLVSYPASYQGGLLDIPLQIGSAEGRIELYAQHTFDRIGLQCSAGGGSQSAIGTEGISPVLSTIGPLGDQGD